MSEQLQILILEDRATDAELMMRELRREGIEFSAKRVWTEADYLAGLRNPALSLILADFQLPSYDGLSALELARKECPRVPFIFVSGTLGEETAVDAMHHGATDYVLKQRLTRLGPSVTRALRQAEEHKLIAQMAQRLTESEKRLRQALEAGQMGAWEFDIISNTSWRTPRHDHIFGYTSPPAEWNYEILLQHVVPEDLDLVKRCFAQALSTDRLSLECRIARPGQEPRWIAMQGRVSRNEKGERVRLMGTVSDISERKLMEKVLRENEQRFRLLADNASDVIWTLDASGRLNYASPSVQRLLGYTPAEVLSCGMDRVLTAASATAARKRLDKIILKKQSSQHVRETFELDYIRKDGWTVCCEVSCGGMFDASGKFMGIVGVSRDISARKRTDKALRESEARYRAVTQSANDAIITVNDAGTIVGWNLGAEKIFGYVEAEVLKQSLTPLLPPRFRDQHLGGMKRMQTSGETHVIGKTVELAGLRKDGSEFPLELSLAKWEVATGRFYTGIIRDITERKRVQEAHTRLATAVEQAAETIEITDAQATILYINPAFEKTTGYTREEAIGQNPRILKSGKQDAEFYQRMWAVLTAGEVWRGQLINKKKDGTLYEEDATISPVCDAAGKIVNYVAVKRDVTREVAMESQLRESQKMEAIGTLAGGVAHEINNPINGIMNYAQLITDQLPADSPLQQFSANIMKETNRVSQIVRNLLSFARQNPQQRSPANLNDIIKSVLTLVQSVIRHDQITLTVEVPEGLPQMECRSQQLEQVLLNLLTNARDALNEKYPAYHEDKIIRVTARLFEQDGTRWIRTTVEDRANGIPVEIRDRVLDPFFTTKPAGKGTGLGLSISHGIVKDHKGKLHFETETGRGTRFHMDLPVK